MRTTTPGVGGLFAAATLASMAFGYLAHAVLAGIVATPSALEVSQRFGLLPMYLPLVHPEPVESATFVSTLVAALAAFSVAAWLSVKLDGKPVARLPACLLIAGACAAVAWWLVAFLSSPPGFPVAGLIALGLEQDDNGFLLQAIVFAVVIFVLAMGPQKGIWKSVAGCLVAVPIAMLVRYSILGNDDAYVANTHYEVFVYPVVQDWLGSAVALGSGGQESQYGLYPLLLRPVWFLTGGPSTLAITGVMAALLLLAFLLLLVFMTRFTHGPVLAAVLTLACVMGLLLFPLWPADPYYQFFPVRLLFPTIAMGLMCLAPEHNRSPFRAYLVLAVGFVWNVESAIAALAMYGVFVVASQEVRGAVARLRFMLLNAVLAAAAIAIVAATVVLYYLIRFGSAPSLDSYLHSVRAFSGGVGALPMPPFGAWGLPCLAYAISIFVALRVLWKNPDRCERRRAAALLALAAGGIVWFRYYQVRSSPEQLQLAAFPALCCGALLVDRLLRTLAARRWATALVSAAIGAPLAAAFSVWWSSPYSDLRSSMSIAHASHPDATWNRAADAVVTAFEKVRQHEGDELLLLAPYAQLVNLKRGAAGPVRAAGLCQIWFEPELANVLRIASSPRTVLVVVDASDTCAPLQGTRARDRLEPRLGELLEREFVRVEGKDVKGSDCQEPTYFVRKGVPSDRLTASGESTANLAQGRHATQSSSLAGADASLAVDGNVDGAFAHKSVAHTLRERGAWWEVDLGAERELSSIEVWNRTDCCAERLRNFWVLASENALPVSGAPATIAKQPGVHGVFRAVSCRMTRVEAGFRARFVRIQLEGTDYLSLAEVRVMSR